MTPTENRYLKYKSRDMERLQKSDVELLQLIINTLLFAPSQLDAILPQTETLLVQQSKKLRTKKIDAVLRECQTVGTSFLVYDLSMLFLYILYLI